MLLKRRPAQIPPAVGLSRPKSAKPPRWYELGGVLLVGWLVLLALTPHVTEWLNPPTGDEPFYLVTAISLIKDHDLDEYNNYYFRDYQDFAPTCADMAKPRWGDVGPDAIDSVPGVYAPGLRNCPGTPEGFMELPPHFSKEVIREGYYTKHGVGLSFLIAPFYALGGRLLVVVFLNFLAALVGLNCWLLAWEMTGRKGIAWLTWGAMLFTAPLWPFAYLIFPAMPAALMTVYSWRRLRLAAQARLAAQEKGSPALAVNGPGRAILIGLCLAFLPWLHSVYLSVSIPLFLYFLLGGRVRYRREIMPGWSAVAVALLLLPIIVLGSLFVGYYLYLYGTPLPNTQDHAGFAPFYELWQGSLGLLFDQKYGLLVYAPYYLLAFVGLALMGWDGRNRQQTARRRSDLLWLGVALLPNFLVMSSYNQWWGEWGPPDRYLVPLIPVLAAPLAVALAEARNWFSRIFFDAALFWSGVITVAWMINPHLMFHWQDDKPAKLLTWLEQKVELFRGVNLAGWFPSYVTNLQANNGQPNYLAAIIWLCAAFFVAVLATFLTVRKRSKIFTTQDIEASQRATEESKIERLMTEEI